MKTVKKPPCQYSFSLMLTIILIFYFFTGLSFAVAESPKIIMENKAGSDNTLPGVYFYRFEPSFYTGFSPRCQDTRRIFIHLGRGNQLRITVVLSDRIIDEYISDLSFRYHVYEELINRSRIFLTQNIGYQKFKDKIINEEILSLTEQKATLDKLIFRKKSLEKLDKLNPGKLFHIKIDFSRRMREWSTQLRGLEGRKISQAESLDLINDILPTRLILTGLSTEMRKKLRSVINLYAHFEKDGNPDTWDRFYHAATELFDSATGGIYRLKGNMLDFYEFTAIYPVGTLNQFTKYDGQNIPLYPFPGKRRLHIHQRTRVVDHIPEAACYGYLPWIPYMHVGKKLHNSFHTLWFNIDTRVNKFIPLHWRKNSAGSLSGKPYPHLWLVSRGPMSHGCTHVNAGHISELRQLLPSAEEALHKVLTYRNKSNHFDVFDIDGDGKPEVTGVKYYYSYSLKNKKPYRMRASSDRQSFYKWLYKDGYRYDKESRLIFDQVTTSKFIGNKAVKGKSYQNIPLYEADYSPESIQFYKSSSISFIRELRRVSSTFDLNRKILKLDRN